MKRLFRAALIASSLLVGTASCELILHETKVDKGQLYECGDAKYDNYFSAVHAKQVAALKWDEERRNGRTNLFVAVQVPVTATDNQIMRSVRAKRGDANVARAANDTIHGEHERAVRLRGAIPGMEDLMRQGESLTPHVRETFRPQGEDKVREVKDELSAAVTVLKKRVSDAQEGAGDAEKFADDLSVALTGQKPLPDDSTPAASAKPAASGGSTPSASASPSPNTSASTAPKASATGKTDSPKPRAKPPESKPEPKPETKPEPKPEPTTPDKPKPPAQDEPFNP